MTLMIAKTKFPLLEQLRWGYCTFQAEDQDQMEQNNVEYQFQSEYACAGSQFAQWFSAVGWNH